MPVLDSVAKIRPLIALYVAEYNSTLPYAALRAQSPDEMYLGMEAAVPEQLREARRAARAARLEKTRARRSPTGALGIADENGGRVANSSALLMNKSSVDGRLVMSCRRVAEAEDVRTDNAPADTAARQEANSAAGDEIRQKS